MSLLIVAVLLWPVRSTAKNTNSSKRERLQVRNSLPSQGCIDINVRQKGDDDAMRFISQCPMSTYNASR